MKDFFHTCGRPLNPTVTNAGCVNENRASVDDGQCLMSYKCCEIPFLPLYIYRATLSVNTLCLCHIIGEVSAVQHATHSTDIRKNVNLVISILNVKFWFNVYYYYYY